MYDMKFAAYIAVLTAGIASAADAGSVCIFTTECFEDEACAETSFTMEFRAGTGGPNDIELVTDAETIGVAVGGDGQVAHLAGMTESGFHVLTLTRATGAARYTNHIDEGPATVSYLGTCEVQ